MFEVYRDPPLTAQSGNLFNLFVELDENGDVLYLTCFTGVFGSRSTAAEEELTFPGAGGNTSPRLCRVMSRILRSGATVENLIS